MFYALLTKLENRVDVVIASTGSYNVFFFFFIIKRATVNFLSRIRMSNYIKLIICAIILTGY